EEGKTQEVAPASLCCAIASEGGNDGGNDGGNARDGRSTLDAVREILAQRVELPVHLITNDLRLMRDLHLSSIAVGQLVVEAARSLNLPPPVAATEFATATVAEVAAALDELATAEHCSPAAASEATVSGVGEWFSFFEEVLIRRDMPEQRHAELHTDNHCDAHLSSVTLDQPSRESSRMGWQHVCQLQDQAVTNEIIALLNRSQTADGVLIMLPDTPDVRHAALVIEGVTAWRKRVAAAKGVAIPLVVVDDGFGGSGAIRSVACEFPRDRILLVRIARRREGDQAADCGWLGGIIARELMAADHDYHEVYFDDRGIRHVPRLRVAAYEPQASVELSAADVVLVTGGARGIGAECGLSLARGTDAIVVLVGRTASNDDDEVKRNLARFRNAGCNAHYVTADLADEEAVRRLVTDVRRKYGDVTAILHAAGVNRPALCEQLTVDDFVETVKPKVEGLKWLLTEIDGPSLKLLISFGSVIARTGMVGETHYALANTWLAQVTQQWQSGHPLCRCVTMEWSVWSGVGMGERLGTLESLRLQGITPIGTDDGVEMFEKLLQSDRFAAGVVAAGRFGEPRTLLFEKDELPLLRFLEDVKYHVPGVELVADSELTLFNDPYLAEHAYDGTPLLPAVVSFEAMAQVAAALAKEKSPAAIEFVDVLLERPVAVNGAGATTLRVCGVRENGDCFRFAIRDSNSRFHTDDFRARMVYHDETALDELLLRPRLVWSNVARTSTNGDVESPAEATSAAPLYADVLFHRGRFQRVAKYFGLSARKCHARVLAVAKEQWFASFMPHQLLLGDPAVRDAAIHAIQACIPHVTVLPVRIESLVVCPEVEDDHYEVFAVEQWDDGEKLCYDVEVVTSDGRLRERWTGLTLQRVGNVKSPSEMPSVVWGTHIQRRIEERVGALVQVQILNRQSATEMSQRQQLEEAVSFALGRPRQILHRPDGKPEICGSDEQISISHSDDMSMVVVSRGRIGCDVESVVARDPIVWEEMLGQEYSALVASVTRSTGEPIDVVATRIWCVIESVKKCGLLGSLSITFDEPHGDEWVLFHCGKFAIPTVFFASSSSSADGAGIGNVFAIAVDRRAPVTAVTGSSDREGADWSSADVTEIYEKSDEQTV
ncbi:MAG: SDR family NAD(P)-dependent oxidoreductase, partial [Planctomycetales bacterium]|nr:SDR family NAD(P)-dependent oxidoreductase [Planctomycetales bacterium]